LPLPTSRFVVSQEELRKVSRDCLVPFRANRYGVPLAYAGKRVWVRCMQGHTLQVHNQRGNSSPATYWRRGKGRQSSSVGGVKAPPSAAGVLFATPPVS